MSRRTITQKATNNKYKCFFFFAIKYDSFWFYLAPKVGYQFHSNHSKLSKEQIIFPPCLLNNETKVITDKISIADGSHTIDANIVFHTIGVMLSRNNIHYISGLYSELENLDGIRKQIDKENDE